MHVSVVKTSEGTPTEEQHEFVLFIQLYKMCHFHQP